ncbi:hypothetical protein [Levilactobacillus yonginensis]|uniref:hypothetical protein n=1 Tax=Levilactobacillus yonginensis TaxID=1054041 RepID=UPI00345DC8B6
MKKHNFFKIVVRILFLLVVGVVVFFTVKSMNKIYISKFGNKHYYQRVKSVSTNDGLVNQKIYSKATLKKLTTVTHGTKYTGNTSLDRVSETYHYKIKKDNISNFMGNDGVLQLYNKSKFMSDAMVRDAAMMWNTLAGQTIVEVVDSQNKSDEVIHDSQKKTKYGVGGQSYNGMGMIFYPNDWAVTGLTKQNKQNWKEAILLKEMGHALGVPNMGGGLMGTNDQVANLKNADFMGAWGVQLSNAPKSNLKGITTTRMDGAVLKIAGIAWPRPRKLANWVLTKPSAHMVYNNGKITSTIPK